MDSRTRFDPTQRRNLSQRKNGPLTHLSWFVFVCVCVQEDYEIGAVIKDKIIPHAVSWFTGEALMEEEESGEEEEGSDEEDEDGEDDGGARQRQQQVRAQSNSGASPSEGEQPECKQQ